MKKYISCLLLLLALVLPMLGMEAQAATTGTCGENVAWSLDDAGILTISGTGAMADYASASDVPWYASRASVKSVVIKDGVTTIGDRAFYNCAVLTDVTVGSGVETVGTFAFQGCSALGEIVLSAAVTALEDSAFRGCAALDAMTFGGNAPALGSNVFTDGASDMTVWYYEGSTGFDAAPWTDFYHETMHVGQWVVDTEPGCTTDGSKHIDCTYCETTITETIPSRHDYVDGVCSGCQKVELLDSGTCGDDLTWELDIRGVLTISGTGSMRDYWSSSTAPWSEHAENIISVIIEEGVTSISNYAFKDCTSLESVTIGDSVTTIGNYAFRSCSSLESVTIPEGVPEISSSAFSGCSSLESVTIPDSVTEIGRDAFYNCSSLVSITIPEGVTEISSSAFSDCSSLESVTIGNGVTSIGYYAFRNCTSLSSITIPDSVTSIGDYAFRNCTSLSSITIPDSVTSIGDYAFCNCSSLKSITIPDSVTTIGFNAFSGCSSLTDVYITDVAAWLNISFGGSYANPLENNDLSKKLYLNGNLVTNLVIPEGVTTIGYYAFSGCSSLESVTIGDSVTEIGSCAFENCSSLESVTIPDSVTEIGSWAFYSCSSLASVTIGDSVTTIGNYAFRSCSSLESITIGNGVTTIGDYAFEDCSSLKSVIIPDSVTYIGFGAFYNSSLTTVHYAGTEAQKADISNASGNWELKEATWHYECTGDNCPNPFVDVVADAYYAEPVLWAVNNGITNGLSENTFGPAETCTRGQIVTFLWRANGSPEPKNSSNPFWDVTEGDYFYKAVLWAVENGITSGMGDGSFAPGAPCTRGQVATFLWRACGQPAPSGTNIFTDIAPGAYYYDAVLWAVENGITNGMGDGTFAPDAPCTRGQIVTFLYRAMA